MSRAEIPPTPAGGAIEDLGAVLRGVAVEVMQAARRLLPPERVAAPVDLASGGFDLHPGARLEIAPLLRADPEAVLHGDPVTLWGAAGLRVHILRGEPVRVSRSGNLYHLAWVRGPLELNVPRRLALLAVRAAGSTMAIHGHEGPLQVDLAGGFLRLFGATAPFRVRAIQAPVVVRGCALAEGHASIHSAGGDVVVELDARASLELEARTAGGRVELPPEGALWRGRARSGRITRARGTMGAGRGRLEIDSMGGWIRVRLAPTDD